MTFLIFITELTSFLGAAFFSINLGFAQFTLVRIWLFLLAFVVFIKLAIAKNRNEERLNLKKIIYNKHIVFLIIWFVYAIISGLWVKDYFLWARSVYFVGVGMLGSIILATVLTDKKKFMAAFYAIEVVTGIFCIVGNYEVITGNYYFTPNEKFLQLIDVGRVENVPLFVTSNPNDFALIVCYGFFIAYICFTQKKKGIGKLFSLLVMGISIQMIVMSASRAVLLGFLLAGLPLVNFSIKKIRRVEGRLLCRLISLLALAGLFPWVWQSGAINVNFTSGTSEIIRMNLIKNGLYFLKKTYFLGVGSGNVTYWMMTNSQYYTGRVLLIHNWWVEILASYGLIIFTLYTQFYITLLCQLHRIYKRSCNAFAVSVASGLMSFLIAFIVLGVASSSNLSKEWLWLFWGLAIAFEQQFSPSCST